MENNYNASQAAKLLGIKPRTLRQWISDGKLQAKKYGFSNRWYITEEEIQRVKGTRYDNEG